MCCPKKLPAVPAHLVPAGGATFSDQDRDPLARLGPRCCSPGAVLSETEEHQCSIPPLCIPPLPTPHPMAGAAHADPSPWEASKLILPTLQRRLEMITLLKNIISVCSFMGLCSAPHDTAGLLGTGNLWGSR